MVAAGSDDETPAGGVGAVKEDVVVDPAGVTGGGLRDVDEPKGGEPALQGAWATPHPGRRVRPVWHRW